MKKISVLLTLALLLLGFGFQPCNAGIIANQKARIEQHKQYKSTLQHIKKVIEKQDELANKHDLKKLGFLYSDNFVNSDGFNKEAYFKLIEDTWESYPDISYKTVIKHIDFTDNYATVLVEETAVSAPVETIGKYDTIGEMYSVAKSVYHLEKQGLIWKISSEKIIEENSTLKFGEARYIDFELNAPKQIGSGQNYTVTLKIKAPEDAIVVASINREKTVYPQTKSEDVFRKVSDDGVLERVFKSNTDNINEYAVTSIGITHAENYDENHIKVYMNGMAFIMTRINVIPENKFIDLSKKDKKHE